MSVSVKYLTVRVDHFELMVNWSVSVEAVDADKLSLFKNMVGWS